MLDRNGHSNVIISTNTYSTNCGDMGTLPLILEPKSDYSYSATRSVATKWHSTLTSISVRRHTLNDEVSLG